MQINRKIIDKNSVCESFCETVSLTKRKHIKRLHQRSGSRRASISFPVLERSSVFLWEENDSTNRVAICFRKGAKQFSVQLFMIDISTFPDLEQVEKCLKDGLVIGALEDQILHLLLGAQSSIFWAIFPPYRLLAKQCKNGLKPKCFSLQSEPLWLQHDPLFYL